MLKGKGINEKCFNDKGDCIIECDKEYFRPLEVDTLLGNSSKARKELNWKPVINIKVGLSKTVDWYLNNLSYFSSISKKEHEKRIGLRT